MREIRVKVEILCDVIYEIHTRNGVYDSVVNICICMAVSHKMLVVHAFTKMTIVLSGPTVKNTCFTSSHELVLPRGQCRLWKNDTFFTNLLDSDKK